MEKLFSALEFSLDAKQCW